MESFEARDAALLHCSSCNFGSHFVRDATLAYKAEALELQRQLRYVQSQYDMLTVQASSLIQGRRARVAATSTVNGQLAALDDSLSARNLQVIVSTGIISLLIDGNEIIIKPGIALSSSQPKKSQHASRKDGFIMGI